MRTTHWSVLSAVAVVLSGCTAATASDGGSGGGGGGGASALGGGGGSGGGSGGGGGGSGGGGGGASTEAPSGTLLFTTPQSGDGGQILRHVWTATVTAGAAGPATQWTTGDVVDDALSFSLDGGAALFVRRAAGQASSAPQSLRVLDLADGGERELATCDGAGSQTVECVTPIMGADGYVYYGDRAQGGPSASVSVKRVPFEGGTPSVIMTLGAACFLKLAGSRDRSQLLVTAFGSSCTTTGNTIITLPGLATVATPAPGVADVTFLTYPQFDHSGDALVAMGGTLTNAGVTMRLFRWTAAAPTPTPVAELGTYMPSGSGHFVFHDTTTLIIASGWLSTVTSPATQSAFQGTPQVAAFDWR